MVHINFFESMTPNISGNLFPSLVKRQFEEFYCFMILASGLVFELLKVSFFKNKIL